MAKIAFLKLGVSIGVYLALLCSSCVNHGNTKFKVTIHKATSNTKARKTFFYFGKYIVVGTQGKSSLLSADFEVDTALTQIFNSKHSNNINLVNDTLFATVRIDYSSKKYYIYYLDKHFRWNFYDTLNEKNYMRLFNDYLVYTDNRFQVTASCMGEFGGSVFFEDLITHKFYCYPSTCYASLNKIKNEYYLTSSLAHMSGSTEIVKIPDPTKLYNRKEGLLKIVNDSMDEIHLNWWVKDLENHSNPDSFWLELKKGSIPLVDTIDLLTVAAFEYNQNFYQLIYNQRNTLITALTPVGLKTIDTIPNTKIFSESPNCTKYNDRYISSFTNSYKTGFIVIKNDSISIVELVDSNTNN